MPSYINMDDIIDEITKIIRLGELSSAEYSSIDHPFFMKDNVAKVELNNIPIPRIDDFNNLPSELLNFYKIIGDSTKEWYSVKNSLTMMSWDNALKLYDEKAKENQKQMFYVVVVSD